MQFEVKNMDIKRKRELLEAYKNRHPEMGVISFHCSATGESFLTTATDIPAKFNGIRFQLSVGNCPNKRLQELWSQHGEDGIELRVVKTLKYENPAEDHTEELEKLCELCLLENPNARRLWK